MDMEVPVVNRLSNFESLNNPSLISQILTISGIEKIYQQQPYNIWTWGALILAILASFPTIINRINILIVKIKQYNKSFHYKPLIYNDDDDDEDDDDSDTESLSSCSSSDDEGDEEEEEEEEKICGFSGYDDSDDVKWQNRNFLRFGGGGGGSFSDLLTWSENSVVKLWDNLGLVLENTCDDDDNYYCCGMDNLFGVYDITNDQKITSFFGGKKYEIPAVSTSGDNRMIVSAAANQSCGGGGVSIKGWDTRVACRIPAIIAEWRPKIGKIVGVNVSGNDKVYVRDDVTGGVTVGDMRNVASPLVTVTESEVDTRWDTDSCNYNKR